MKPETMLAIIFLTINRYTTVWLLSYTLNI